MPEAPQWARVRGEMNYHVRRGAWYEVLRVTGEDAILEVNRRPVAWSGRGWDLPSAAAAVVGRGRPATRSTCP